MKKNELPPVEVLRDRFEYSPVTGLVYNKKTGKVVGEKSGYKRVTINNIQYKLHRIIWKLVTGEEPDFVDHINRDNQDNSWSNLRNVDSSINNANRKSYGKYLKGVRPHNSKFRAVITIKGTKHILGSFSTEEEAHKCFMEAHKNYYG